MIDPNIIIRGAEQAQRQQQQNMESLGNLGQMLGLRTLQSRANQMRQLPQDQRQSFANNSIFSSYLNDMNKNDQLTTAKNALDQQKTLADIGNINAQAAERNANAGNTSQKTNLGKFGAIQGAFQQAALSGDKNTALLALNGLQRAGAITPEEYSQQFDIIQAMNPDEFKTYASGLASNNKDMSPYLFQTKNNVADNATSLANNQNTVNATIRGQDITAQTAANNLEQQSKQFNQNFEYQKQQDEIKNKQAEIKEFGGKAYIVYKNGDYKPALDINGQQISTQIKGGMTEQQSKDALFGARMQEANKSLVDLEGNKVSTPMLNRMFGETGSSIAAALPSALGGASENQAKYVQAQRDFINAVLRKESGAVISPQEFANAQRQYFPQVGDSKSVIEQKAKNRELATSMIIASSGQEGQKLINQNTSQAPQINGTTMTRNDLIQGAKQAGVSPEQFAQFLQQQGVTIQ